MNIQEIRALAEQALADNEKSGASQGEWDTSYLDCVSSDPHESAEIVGNDVSAAVERAMNREPALARALLLMLPVVEAALNLNREMLCVTGYDDTLTALEQAVAVLADVRPGPPGK